MSNMTSNQVELPFEDNGFTQSKQLLLASLKLRRKARRDLRRSGLAMLEKPSLEGVNLTQPLLEDVLFGLEMDWDGHMGDATKRPEVVRGIFRRISDKPEVHKNEPYRCNSEFGLLNVQSIARMAAGLLYGELSVLLNERGNASLKAEIIDWIFASSHPWQFWDRDGKPALAMYEVPFTAQFCCMVEEIDHEDLCERISLGVDALRQRQRLQASAISTLQGATSHDNSREKQKNRTQAYC